MIEEKVNNVALGVSLTVVEIAQNEQEMEETVSSSNHVLQYMMRQFLDHAFL